MQIKMELSELISISYIIVTLIQCAKGFHARHTRNAVPAKKIFFANGGGPKVETLFDKCHQKNCIASYDRGEYIQGSCTSAFFSR